MVAVVTAHLLVHHVLTMPSCQFWDGSPWTPHCNIQIGTGKGAQNGKALSLFVRAFLIGIGVLWLHSKLSGGKKKDKG